MPIICSTCGGNKPYGDFLQISYKADPQGYCREVRQRANGIRISEWSVWSSETERLSGRPAGIYCMHDDSPVLDEILMSEEAELLTDRRFPVQQSFSAEELSVELSKLSERVRSEVYVHEIAAEQGAYAENLTMADWMKNKLRAMGIEQLYAHQGEAIQAVRQGRNVVISTKTASGKSLAYNVPIIEKLVSDSDACALYLSPFKALALNQFTYLKRWVDPDQADAVSMDGFSKFCINGKELAAGILQGQRNVPNHMRRDQASSLVFAQGRYWMTNVHYLHLILQNARTGQGKGPQLLRFLKNLRFVVIDELHQYSGLLGSKVSLVIRRLRMLCERLGNRNVQFIACSATIANPKYLAEELTGKRGIQGFYEVIGSQAPVRRKEVLIWNPGLAEQEKKRAAVSDLYEILRTIYANGRWPRSIIFTSNRQQAQLLSRDLNMIIRAHLQENRDMDSDDRQDLFLPYHSYLPQETKERTIQQLEQGEILGIVTTNALEVGIDITCLDVCIMLGYPGSQASFWQQAGRAGRSRDGVVIMLMQEEPLQQYFARNPLVFFQQSPESAAIHISNPRLLQEHLAYAAHEQGGAINNAVNYVRSSALRKVAEADERLWQQSDGNLIYQGEAPIYQALMTMGETYTVVVKNGWNEEILFQNVDARSLIRDYHVDAIFLGSDNRTFYKVRWVNNKQRKVGAEPVRSDYHTRGIIRDSIEVAQVTKTVGGGERLNMCLGHILVKRSTFGYKKVYMHSSKPSETVQLTNTYPVSFQTDALWLMWDEPGRSELRSLFKMMQADNGSSLEELIEGSIHAAEHAISSVIPAVVKCSRSDVQHVSFYSGSALFGMPGLFIYDSQAGGGSGIVDIAAEKFLVLLEKAKQLMSSCVCTEGCPSCIQLFQCERQNEPLHKAGGVVVLEYLLRELGTSAV
ncbi:DEAD/DEAH box helicase [Paenibacillus sp. N4]|uniref:DEAD/DEAH box helicase n=1 Tax=Paenibacillus vietnamensis TaxID=2590547 RepID=UPI001CD0A63B|nr:DEAD/DEAH box helicase [Paenibacillus vietnamensis]MCA0757015.1 DEAD/DEAH box helicase [Paenibacillus vietnamensis]